MLRKLAKSAIAHSLGRTGGDRWLGSLTGVRSEPLVLGYHRVLPDAGPESYAGMPGMTISVATLEKQLDFVGRRFRYVSLDELGARIQEGRAAGLAAVTFDDGYADFAENAFPCLQRKGIPSAVFVVTGLAATAAPFHHDRVYILVEAALARWGAERTSRFLAEKGYPEATRPLPEAPFPAARKLLAALERDAVVELCSALELELGGAATPPRSLSWDELAEMSRRGLTVASHTRTHTLLTRESAPRVKEETTGARADIEEKLGVPPAHFAYPDGRFDAAAVRAVADAGYRFAYTGCRHRDAEHPLLTLSRRVLWEGSSRGPLGRFSEDILGCQINGVFDRADDCPGNHS